MCGIAGAYAYGSGAPIAPYLMAAMTDVIRHRGPDDAGVYLDGAVGLCCDRQFRLS